jgi:ubiquinol-cytochrome c reductase cytochrome c subunit
MFGLSRVKPIQALPHKDTDMTPSFNQTQALQTTQASPVHQLKAFKVSAVVVLTASLCLLSAPSTWAASAEKGKEAFMKNGCWQCHGTEGQGGAAGLKLAPSPKPLAYISAFIRNTNGPMPPYTEKILSESDVADIHAYLQSVPPAPDPKTLPALN